MGLVEQLEARARVVGNLLWLPSGLWSVRMLYVLGISVVAGILFVAVNEFEPDRRLALALKFLIIFVSVAAVAGRLTP